MDRDRLELATPEGVTLELTLAGIGSRGVAAFIDLVIQFLALWLVTLILGGTSGGPVAVVVLTVAWVVVIVGYHVYFEVYVGGKSPGKRVMRLRVLRTDGGPVGLTGSLIRTFIRIIDFLPTFYLIGMIAVFFSEKNQRLGDMAGSTVVVQETPGEPVVAEPTDWERMARRSADVAARARSSASELTGWDVSQVTADEVALVRRFLERRGSMNLDAENRLAEDLQRRLEPRVTRPNAWMSPFKFLETVVRLKLGERR